VGAGDAAAGSCPSPAARAVAVCGWRRRRKERRKGKKRRGKK
jgi:hypothetical protein